MPLAPKWGTPHQKENPRAATGPGFQFRTGRQATGNTPNAICRRLRGRAARAKALHTAVGSGDTLLRFRFAMFQATLVSRSAYRGIDLLAFSGAVRQHAEKRPVSQIWSANRSLPNLNPLRSVQAGCHGSRKRIALAAPRHCPNDGALTAPEPERSR